ncbi:DMT family transporter [Roseobacter sp. HKCCA0434]|uniref:DMT family transporter n=1 Tax=Roseobacter sp. HKCCA0434 TaxID=3079297 RepID=UPI002905F0C4|nr:DMT family transporter [Roseobacter sp. HKCCA0434]
MPRQDIPSYLAIAALTVIWGSAFALTAVALRGFGPVAVVTGRAGLAAIVLVAAAFAVGQGLPRDRVAWAWCAVIGITSLALPFTLLTWAQQFIPSSLAAVLISTSPLFILLLARLILATRIGARQWVGFATGFAGLVWLIGPDAMTLARADLLPQLACLATAFCYGLSSVLVRRMPPVPPVQATAASQLVAAIVLVPFGLSSLLDAAPVAGWGALLALAVLGLVQTGGAQLLRYWTVRRAGPVFTSSVSYLIPVWAGVVGIVLLDEPLTWRLVGGFALILAGLTVARNRPEPQPTAARSSAG